MPDDEAAQDAVLLLQAVRDLHKQQHPSMPLAPGTPVAPDIAAGQSQPEINPGLNLRRYEAALWWLEAEEALAPQPAAWRCCEEIRPPAPLYIQRRRETVWKL